MKRILLSLFALASVAGACDDPAAESLAVSQDDSAEVEFRGLCDEHPISSIFWEGVTPLFEADEAYWCSFILECNEISDGKPTCNEEGELGIVCYCGGEYFCQAWPGFDDYHCGEVDP